MPFDPAAATSPRTDVFIGLVGYDPSAPPIDARHDNVTIDALP